MKFIDRILKNPNKIKLKDSLSGEIKTYEIQEPTEEEIIQDSDTPITASNLNKITSDILELVFPVGSTYITQEDVNPNAILGFGTWERFKGRVGIGLDENINEFKNIGNIGGEKDHTLKITEIPKHSHSMYAEGYWAFGVRSYRVGSGDSILWLNQRQEPTGETGQGESHNNMQPYEIVGYVWIRRA